eukprot:Anaeramoba_ignava/c16767_g1_i1.p1 GENE.c16767_g1_i1~~c16767_g1_i1.p1  ORF type:complete len:322 (+),score=117.20 c16767_g1_i1:1-966(+)
MIEKVYQEMEKFTKFIESKYSFTKKGDIIDISVKDYISKSNFWKSKYVGYRVSLDFNEKHVGIDPYLLGFWFGSQKIPKGSIIPENLKAKLYSFQFQKLKHIPEEYIFNSRNCRSSFIRGFFDSKEIQPIYSKFNCDFYDQNTLFSHENEEFIQDLIYLMKSIGFAVIKSQNSDLVCVPQQKHLIGNYCDILTSKIGIEPIGKDKYYGFGIDGNQRFLLGDFSVTHNSTIAESLSRSLNRTLLRFSFLELSSLSSIKGKRKIEMGAIPGKIIRELISVKRNNPVILIEEIDQLDKFRMSYDAKAAFFEMLDPDLNQEFCKK